ncbi:membrane protein implicated in regulation of membrane protease activity [Bacilli bacterium PM5-3]|nr:membrane protein implicated in regulation of membrane protease activity [Bacilli bacterium PM5-3]
MDTMLIIWLIVIIGFLVIEIMTPSFFSISFSIAGVVALIVYFLGFGIMAQLVAYTITVAITLYFLIPILRKISNVKSNQNGPVVRTNLDLIIGEVGICLEKISLLQDGLVKIEGKEWTAKVTDDIEIEAQTPVIIKEIQGSKVIVEPAKKEREE